MLCLLGEGHSYVCLNLWMLLMQVRASLKAGRFKDLVPADELGIMMRNNKAFQGWKEGPLSFPPTFKFKRGTPHYLGGHVFCHIMQCTCHQLC